MAVNSGQIDLNSDAILFDRETEVLGLKSSGSIVNVSVSHSETLSGNPVVGGEVLVNDQKVCHVGDDRGTIVSLELLSGMNPGCDVLINANGKEGLCGESTLEGVANGLEARVKVVDGGCDGKVGEFSCELMTNEDKKSEIECSNGAPFAYGGAEPDKGLVFENNDGVQKELECENARDVAENGLPSTDATSNNVAQGVDDNLTECEKEVKNSALVNLSAIVEDDGEMNAADCLVTMDGLEDLHALEVLQAGVPYMEDMDVDARESLHVKDLSRNHSEPEASYELKQATFQVDAEVDVMQNQTIGVGISEARMFENFQNECHGLNLVVDLNSYGNLQEAGMYWEPVFPELNFSVADLVWGKVTGHPWWPGQIFDSSAASEKAKRHLKEDSYLIAYFGDQTFAWNDASMIKPFQVNFSQMEKQTNLENFHHAVDRALDEVSRRVEFGLSCPCMPEEMFLKLKTQVISNAGIRKQSSIRNGGDRFINATSFEPMKLVNFVKSLAQTPLVEDRLNFVIARAQLLAFYRSKGYSQLPEFAVVSGLFGSDMEDLLMREKEQCDHQIYEQESKTHIGCSEKHQHLSWDSKQPSKKHKLLSDLMSGKSFYIPHGEHISEWKANDKPIPRRPGRKRKTASETPEDYFHNSQTQLQYVSTNDMLSQLCLAAKDPVGENFSSDMVHFFTEFRKSNSIDCSASLDQGMCLEQMHDGETGVTSTEALASMTSTMEPCNDSYWTDRIIQSISGNGEQSLSKYQNLRGDFLPVTPSEASSLSFKSQPAADITSNLGFKLQDTESNPESEPSKVVERLDESSNGGICPTALTLKFTSLDSVPSTTNLNKIFGRFGPLIESKTELLERTNRARVVFQRRTDAETAFSSAGKYSIFGPSLVSYRLKILPRAPPRGTGKRGRKSKKETSSVDGAAV
ncbi:hypothetical protein VNO77_16208 [Canavalia gladiata]|uniref:PWWP domain-containing protein n=1 Tax=Canavalia gladiata TaxID=3824 RepID=A0AAN9QRW7_CANGL